MLSSDRPLWGRQMGMTAVGWEVEAAQHLHDLLELVPTGLYLGPLPSNRGGSRRVTKLGRATPEYCPEELRWDSHPSMLWGPNRLLRPWHTAIKKVVGRTRLLGCAPPHP